MIPLFLSPQVREADDFAINHTGIPGVVLMENASIEIFNQIKNTYPFFSPGIKIGIVCGKGNNGGDGFAVARHFLNNGNSVTVLHLSKMEEMAEDANTNFTVLTKYKQITPLSLKLKKLSSVKDLQLLEGCDIIIDAILGSGFAGELKDLYAKIVEGLNSLTAFKVAIDIPTGLNSDTGYGSVVFNADLTVTLAELKTGLFIADGAKYSGKIVKGSIGISPRFFDNIDVNEYLIEPEDALNFLPVKEKTINKYSAGRVLNISGSGKYPGAPVLASRAAFKIGAGAVVLAFPYGARNILSKDVSEIVYEFYEDGAIEHLTEEGLDKLSERILWADCVLLGPGIGREEATQSAVRKFLRQRKYKKVVLDADALFAIGKNQFEEFNLENAILTPHWGEFANLINVEMSELQKNVLTFGREFVNETGAFLVLKGAPTIIFIPDGEVLINTTGNAGMAKFGTGDVLSGVIAGIASQKEDIEEAVISSVYIHSLSADLLLNEYSEFGFTATDIINNLPKSINFLRNSVV